MEFSNLDKNCREKYYKTGKPELPFFVPKSQIYMYLGHGGDVTDERGNPVIKTVPEGCIYITRAVCGLATHLPFEIFEAFTNPAHEDVWRHPWKHMDTLKRIMNDPALHIHLPGCEYVDNTFYPLSDNASAPQYNRTNPLIQVSGLVALEDAQKIPRDDVRSIYDGNHYSLGFGGRNLSSAASLKIKQEDLMRYFAYSTYPKLIVSDEIFGHAEDTIPLRTIPGFPGYTPYATFHDKLVRKSIKASDLMRIYPGIHFNLLCRFIPPYLDRTAQVLRRKYSMNFQNSAVGTIKESIREGAINTNIATLASSAQESLQTQPMSVLQELRAKASDQYPMTANVLKRIMRKKTMKNRTRNRNRNRKDFIFNDLFDTIKRNDIESFKQKIQSVPTEWIRTDFGAYLVRESFLAQRKPFMRLLCSLGASSDIAYREFQAMKGTKTRKNLSKWRILLASTCSKR